MPEDSSDPNSNRLPLTDPATGKPLHAREQPGFYPGFSTLRQQAYWDDATRRLVLARVGTEKPIRFFTPEEALTMAAVMDRILPQEDRTLDRRIPLLPTLDDRLFHNRIEGYRYADMPSDQEAYQIAVKAFERMAQQRSDRSFHRLKTIEQEEILKSIQNGKPAVTPEMWAGLNLTRFWSLLVSDCISAYYAHPWAWDEIGFGGPAYPRGYMRLEDGEPEPWEVNEQRYAWAAPADTLSDHTEKSQDGGSEQSHPGQGGTH